MSKLGDMDTQLFGSIQRHVLQATVTDALDGMVGSVASFMGACDRSEGATSVVAFGVNNIRAALAYNEVGIDEGYDVFDCDDDGIVSEEDLKEAAQALNLALSDSMVHQLYLCLEDPATKSITRESWAKLLLNLESLSESSFQDIFPMSQIPEETAERNETSDMPLSLSLCQDTSREALEQASASAEEPNNRGEATSDQQSQLSTAIAANPVVSLPALESASRDVNFAMIQIASVIAYNNLTVEEAYDAFDCDEDGKVSKTDLSEAVHTLALDLDSQCVEDVFVFLRGADSGEIPRRVWRAVLDQVRQPPEAAEIKEDQKDSKVECEDGELGPSKASLSSVDAAQSSVSSARDLELCAADNRRRVSAAVQECINDMVEKVGSFVVCLSQANATETLLDLAVRVINAALDYNSISLSEGYDAFDCDEDGEVSMEDLGVASRVLKLGLEPQALGAFHKQLLDPETGTTTKKNWEVVLSRSPQSSADANQTELSRRDDSSEAAGVCTPGNGMREIAKVVMEPEPTVDEVDNAPMEAQTGTGSNPFSGDDTELKLQEMNEHKSTGVSDDDCLLLETPQTKAQLEVSPGEELKDTTGDPQVATAAAPETSSHHMSNFSDDRIQFEPGQANEMTGDIKSEAAGTDACEPADVRSIAASFETSRVGGTLPSDQSVPDTNIGDDKVDELLPKVEWAQERMILEIVREILEATVENVALAVEAGKAVPSPAHDTKDSPAADRESDESAAQEVQGSEVKCAHVDGLEEQAQEYSPASLHEADRTTSSESTISAPTVAIASADVLPLVEATVQEIIGEAVSAAVDSTETAEAGSDPEVRAVEADTGVQEGMNAGEQSMVTTEVSSPENPTSLSITSNEPRLTSLESESHPAPDDGVDPIHPRGAESNERVDHADPQDAASDGDRDRSAMAVESGSMRDVTDAGRAASGAQAGVGLHRPAPKESEPEREYVEEAHVTLEQRDENKTFSSQSELNIPATHSDAISVLPGQINKDEAQVGATPTQNETGGRAVVQAEEGQANPPMMPEEDYPLQKEMAANVIGERVESPAVTGTAEEHVLHSPLANSEDQLTEIKEANDVKMDLLHSEEELNVSSSIKGGDYVATVSDSAASVLVAAPASPQEPSTNSRANKQTPGRLDQSGVLVEVHLAEVQSMQAAYPDASEESLAVVSKQPTAPEQGTKEATVNQLEQLADSVQEGRITEDVRPSETKDEVPSLEQEIDDSFGPLTDESIAIPPDELITQDVKAQIQDSGKVTDLDEKSDETVDSKAETGEEALYFHFIRFCSGALAGSKHGSAQMAAFPENIGRAYQHQLHVMGLQELLEFLRWMDIVPQRMSLVTAAGVFGCISRDAAMAGLEGAVGAVGWFGFRQCLGMIAALCGDNCVLGVEAAKLVAVRQGNCKSPTKTSLSIEHECELSALSAFENTFSTWEVFQNPESWPQRLHEKPKMVPRPPSVDMTACPSPTFQRRHVVVASRQQDTEQEKKFIQVEETVMLFKALGLCPSVVTVSTIATEFRNVLNRSLSLSGSFEGRLGKSQDFNKATFQQYQHIIRGLLTRSEPPKMLRTACVTIASKLALLHMPKSAVFESFDNGAPCPPHVSDPSNYLRASRPSSAPRGRRSKASTPVQSIDPITAHDWLDIDKERPRWRPVAALTKVPWVEHGTFIKAPIIGSAGKNANRSQSNMEPHDSSEGYLVNDSPLSMGHLTQRTTQSMWSPSPPLHSNAHHSGKRRPHSAQVLQSRIRSSDSVPTTRQGADELRKQLNNEFDALVSGLRDIDGKEEDVLVSGGRIIRTKNGADPTYVVPTAPGGRQSWKKAGATVYEEVPIQRMQLSGMKRGTQSRKVQQSRGDKILQDAHREVDKLKAQTVRARKRMSTRFGGSQTVTERGQFYVVSSANKALNTGGMLYSEPLAKILSGYKGNLLDGRLMKVKSLQEARKLWPEGTWSTNEMAKW